MGFHQIFRICLPLKVQELIKFYGEPRKKLCSHGNLFNVNLRDGLPACDGFFKKLLYRLKHDAASIERFQNEGIKLEL